MTIELTERRLEMGRVDATRFVALVWRAQVKHNGRKYHAGYFDSLVAAERAAVALRNRLHTNNLADKEA